MMMKMHGLGDGAYWLVTYTWFWVLYVVYMGIFIGFGSLIGLNMFTKNNLGIQVRPAGGGGGWGRGAGGASRPRQRAAAGRLPPCLVLPAAP
jgi:hypothetical protein